MKKNEFRKVPTKFILTDGVNWDVIGNKPFGRVEWFWHEYGYGFIPYVEYGRLAIGPRVLNEISSFCEEQNRQHGVHFEYRTTD